MDWNTIGFAGGCQLQHLLSCYFPQKYNAPCYYMVDLGNTQYIFIQQAVNGAGPGAWVTGVAAAANIVIFLLSLRYGERSLAVLDWICLIVAAVVIVLWLLHSDATITVSLACVIFIIGLLPTLRKSYYKPHEEAVATFGLNSLKFFLALFALQSVTVVTGLYPLTLGIANGFIVIFLIVRRRQMNRI